MFSTLPLASTLSIFSLFLPRSSTPTLAKILLSESDWVRATTNKDRKSLLLLSLEHHSKCTTPGHVWQRTISASNADDYAQTQ